MVFIIICYFRWFGEDNKLLNCCHGYPDIPIRLNGAESCDKHRRTGPLLFHQSADIIAHGKDKEAQKDADSYGLDVKQRFFRQLFPPNALNNSHHQHAPIQKRNRKKIQKSQIQAEKCNEKDRPHLLHDRKPSGKALPPSS